MLPCRHDCSQHTQLESMVELCGSNPRHTLPRAAFSLWAGYVGVGKEFESSWKKKTYPLVGSGCCQMKVDQFTSSRETFGPSVWEGKDRKVLDMVVSHPPRPWRGTPELAFQAGAGLNSRSSAQTHAQAEGGVQQNLLSFCPSHTSTGPARPTRASWTFPG